MPVYTYLNILDASCQQGPLRKEEGNTGTFHTIFYDLTFPLGGTGMTYHAPYGGTNIYYGEQKTGGSLPAI